MEEELLTVYANDTKLGQMDMTKRTSGEIRFMAWQESMQTTCTFKNGWIWALK
jgi:hypothetical protein